jgi:hypothetical protein
MRIKLLFVLKSVGLSIVIALVLGVITGFIVDYYDPPTFWQILPGWVLSGVLSVLIGIAVSLIISLVMILTNKMNLIKQFVITGIMLFTVNIFQIIWVIIK